MTSLLTQIQVQKPLNTMGNSVKRHPLDGASLQFTAVQLYANEKTISYFSGCGCSNAERSS